MIKWRQSKRLIDFFTKRAISYWRMASANALVTRGRRVYVLAETRKHYVIYAATGGTFAIRLAPGLYVVQQYNPRTGEAVAASPRRWRSLAAVYHA